MYEKSSKGFIIQLVNWIEENMHQNISIDEVTKRSGYQKRQVQILFKRITGITIGQYIKRRRLTKAAVLIKYSSRSIEQVSMDLFYTSQQSFCRAFKKQFKCSPLSYRHSSIIDSSFFLPRYPFNKYIIKKEEGLFLPLSLKTFVYKDALFENKYKNKNLILRLSKITEIVKSKTNAYIISSLDNDVRESLSFNITAKFGFLSTKKDATDIIDFESYLHLTLTDTWENCNEQIRFFFTIINHQIKFPVVERICKTSDDPKDNIYTIDIYTRE